MNKRVKRSFLNGFSSVIVLLLRSILLFAVRIVFVKTLGKVLLGVDSLFTNILLALSLADSGINTAISFKLYEPIANKDYKYINTLMSFYKKIYNVLGLVVISIGLLILPFLNFIVKQDISHIYIIFILYLITAVSTYFISYKNVLLAADQSDYESSIIVCSTYLLMYILQIVSLILFHNFIIFIIVKIIMTIVQQVLVNRKITKKYSMINFKSKDKLPKKEVKSMINSIKAMYMHKIGNYLVTGTDTIIISANPSLGVALVGVYTSYISITGLIDNMLYKGLNGITASYGELSVTENTDAQENVFNIISFLSFILFGLFTTGFMFLLTPFIKLCFGTDFSLNYTILLILCINFFLVGNLKSIDVIKEATGTFISDRYAPLIQAAINLILSIILTIKLGLIGVVLGTLISTILVPLWNKPYIAYKNIFKKSPISYFKTQFIYILTLIINYIITYYILKNINISNSLVSFIIKGLIIVIVYITFISITYWRNSSFNYLKNIIVRKIKRNS